MKWLSFAIAYFFESRLFNGLRPIQIKNFPPAGETRSGCKKAAQRAVGPLLNAARKLTAAKFIIRG
jgi:hypothetical protein